MRNLFIPRNRLERHYVRLIMISLLVPTLLTGGCLYYVIINLMAAELGIPEIIAYHLIPVAERINLFLLISLPLVFLLLYSVGLILARNLVGPIERIRRDLDLVVTGKKTDMLKLRKSDELKPLVDDINALLRRVIKRK